MYNQQGDGLVTQCTRSEAAQLPEDKERVASNGGTYHRTENNLFRLRN